LETLHGSEIFDSSWAVGSLSIGRKRQQSCSPHETISPPKPDAKTQVVATIATNAGVETNEVPTAHSIC
jgi:hypothetical protein